MKTSTRSLLTFGAIFVVLALIVLLQRETPPAQDIPAWAINTTPVFVGFSAQQVQAIRLSTPSTGDTLTLARRDDGTWFVPDSVGRLNSSVAEIAAQTLVLLPYSNTITDSASDLTIYGFDPAPVINMEFVLLNGITHGVSIGFRTPTDTGYYALIDNRPEIYILERAPVDFFISILRTPPIA